MFLVGIILMKGNLLLVVLPFVSFRSHALQVAFHKIHTCTHLVGVIYLTGISFPVFTLGSIFGTLIFRTPFS
jgi:hypothetical protein